jgi:4-amino-4-deoxy-L-arabinose transferase-like glycosyltransferase
MYVYLAVPSVALFGLSEFAVRLPSVVFGVLTVIAVYFLVLEILSRLPEKNETAQFFSLRKTQKIIAFFASFFLAVSPWHLQFSRAAYEGNIGISFFVFGTLFFLKGIRNKSFLIFSAIFFGFSMYSYHSFRILTPLFVAILVSFFLKDLVKNKKSSGLALGIILLFFIPFAQGFFQIGGAGSRLSMVTIFSDPNLLPHSQEQLMYDRSHNDFLGQVLHNRRFVYLQQFAKGYLDHYNPDFLFFHGDGGKQHHAVDMGMLYLLDLPLILFGVYALIRRGGKKIFLLFLWLFIAPLPASITTGTPHPVRAIAMIPVLQIFSAVGVVYVFYIVTSRLNRKIAIVSLSFFSLAFAGNIVYYLHQYYMHTPIEYGYFWQYGNKQALLKAKDLEESKSKIIMSFQYDQPYIYYLFYRKIDPSWYQKNWNYQKNNQIERFRRKIGKYEFRNIDYEKDKNSKNALLIATPDEVPGDVETVDKVFYLDGKIAYKFVATQK